jgi:hypothetical protein
MEGGAEVGKPVLKTGPGLKARGFDTSAFLCSGPAAALLHRADEHPDLVGPLRDHVTPLLARLP